jgi:hypothetical protein
LEQHIFSTGGQTEIQVKSMKHKYSQHPNTGQSGIQMVIFRTLIVSGFRMALAAILLKTTENPTKPDKKITKPDKKVWFSNG